VLRDSNTSASLISGGSASRWKGSWVCLKTTKCYFQPKR
jgi:hypothetical protein